jgi:hypothetical protein
MDDLFQHGAVNEDDDDDGAVTIPVRYGGHIERRPLAGTYSE